jgi:hypothetical protein
VLFLHKNILSLAPQNKQTMILDIVRDIFEKKYRHHFSLDQYASYLEKGNSILEKEGIHTRGTLHQLKVMRMALEYREALLLHMLVSRN